MSLRFLLTSWGNPGNLNPFLTAARRLSQRGHHVRFIDESCHGEEITRAGFDHVDTSKNPEQSLAIQTGFCARGILIRPGRV
jgi:UDP:flavonoid glycosyltransferase YjiC (YdhE family)